VHKTIFVAEHPITISDLSQFWIFFDDVKPGSVPPFPASQPLRPIRDANPSAADPDRIHAS
jgi:hypothetical protein